MKFNFRALASFLPAPLVRSYDRHLMNHILLPLTALSIENLTCGAVLLPYKDVWRCPCCSIKLTPQQQLVIGWMHQQLVIGNQSKAHAPLLSPYLEHPFTGPGSTSMEE